MTARTEAAVDADEAAGADVGGPVERMRREQVRRALRRLEAQGGVTDEQRRTVERLSHRLVGALRDPAARVVASADDRATVRNYFQTE
ncbi:hypothetical protein [Halopelagius longus]|uniref:Glutamyl-tRNA reductase n=1 Tax=Halopelagius longus TaxID=1236180 RepID=A0A1H1FIZ5_9EURY|nr:hypothetical protein [Halopelagius longus]RDI70082.1 hypothetical protein DWB78_15755 [Halopelagius longus]SDR00830.1 glutamyl-tRNA reductase [Halopelagius longus]